MAGASHDPAYLTALDAGGRKATAFAEQILRTTAPFLTKPIAEIDALDVGSGYGFTAMSLAERCRSVVGIEPSEELHGAAVRMQEERRIDHVRFVRGSVYELDAVEEYDLIILDNVFEHLPDQPDALARIARALRPGGAVYILTPNKLWPIEAHYGLPFLAYLPIPLANAYLRVTRRGIDYTDASYAPTYGRLTRLLRAQKDLQHEFVLPASLDLTWEGNVLHYRIGVALLRRFPFLWRISKSFLVIAYKGMAR